MRRRVNLVVLASILLLCGLLLAAGIARIREVAAQARCQDNLKQLGFAIHNYKSATDRFPTATMSETNLSPESRLSYLVEILPYVEAAPMPPYDKTKPWDAEENRPRMFRYQNKEGVEEVGHWGHFKLWICPSRQSDTPLDQFSVTHYVGITGFGRDAASRAADAPAIGFFGYDRLLYARDIKDFSNLLIVIETELHNGPWVASGYPTVRGLDPDGVAYLGKGGQFGGIHKGGTNALFADGSVRVLSDNTSRTVLEAMVTIVPGSP